MNTHKRRPQTAQFALGPGQQSSPARFTSALPRSGEVALGPGQQSSPARFTSALPRFAEFGDVVAAVFDAAKESGQSATTTVALAIRALAATLRHQHSALSVDTAHE